MLLTAEDQVPGGGAEAIPAAYWSSVIPLDNALAAPLGPPEIAVPAYANHGRWIAECPDCSGAQMASPSDYRFMCNLCANVAVGGAWRPVTWPEERDSIEALLIERPLANQNWTPGETLDDLADEQPEGA